MTEAITRIAFAPLLPEWLVLAAAALALLVALAGILLRARGAWLRTLMLAALVLAIANPSLVREKREPQTDVAVVVVDESPSQKLGDRMEQTEAALEALRERAAALDALELRVVRSGERAHETAGEGTRLFSVAESALADVPPGRRAGVIMLTDGQVHDVPGSRSDEDEATGRPGAGVGDEGRAGPAFAGAPPVHALITGRPGERDRRLRVIEAPAYGIVGSTVRLRVAVEDLPRTSAPRGRSAPIEIRVDGRRMPAVGARVGEPTEIEVPLERPGRTIVELEVGEGEHELTLENNSAVVEVEAVRDRLRVLLVSGKPHAGERVWRNLLKSDPAVDLVHFTILRPPHKQDSTPIRELSLIAFPIRELFEERLRDFDLIVFDRYTRRGLIPQTYLANIAAYVERGGALLEAVGPGYADSYTSLARSPVGSVLPTVPTGTIHEAGYRPHVSDIGARHPVTAVLAGGEGEWGRWFRHIDADATGGRVLMTGVGERPLLLLDRVGEGRVGQVLSDHIWLWSRGYEGGGPHGELLRRLAHWLMKEPDLEEEALVAEAVAGRLRIERRTLEDTHPSVTIVHPGGDRRTVELEDEGGGRAAAVVSVDEPGLYRVSDGDRTVLAFAGRPDPVEMLDVRATADRLAPVAEASGGAVSWLSEDGVPSLRQVRPASSAAGRGWIGLRANSDYVVRGVLDVPLLPPLLAVMVILLLAAVTWRRESA